MNTRDTQPNGTMLIIGELQMRMYLDDFRTLALSGSIEPVDLDEVPERPVYRVFFDGWSVNVCVERDSVEHDLIRMYMSGKEDAAAEEE